MSFNGGNVVRAHKKILLLVFLFAFFFTAAHFYLAGRWYFSFSHRRYEIFMLFFQRNLVSFVFYSRSRSFSVIHVRKEIVKIKSKKKDCFIVYILLYFDVDHSSGLKGECILQQISFTRFIVFLASICQLLSLRTLLFLCLGRENQDPKSQTRRGRNQTTRPRKRTRILKRE